MSDEPVQEKPIPASGAPQGTPGDPPPRGVDLQLVGLAAVLWLVAVAIVISKWDRVRVDWRLGDIKERLDLDGGIDDAALEGLVELGRDDPGAVVSLLADELYGPQRNMDERYRIVLVKALERIPGAESLQALMRATGDVDPRVRANVYVSLEARGKSTPADAPAALELLGLALKHEQEPVARSYAVRSLDALGGLGSPQPDACWGFVVAFRDAHPQDDPLARLVRDESARALGLLAKATAGAPQPPDPAADLATREAQVREWEAWFRGQGGTIPDGQGFEAWKARLEASAAPVGTAAPVGKGDGAR